MALFDLLFPQTAKTITKLIMTTQEAVDQLKAVAAQQQKSIGEIGALQDESNAQALRIKDLEEIINAGGEVSTELATALAAVVSGQQAVDDKIPDPPTPVPAPEA